ncbi:g9694 [Coccomyxa elongata]
MYKQIVAGVLVKYVNFGKGWRHRLFVLQNGVLRYYKVFGESRVNVHVLFEQLRKQGELTLIGAETSIVENKWKRNNVLTGISSPGSHEIIAPQAEMHLQVSKLQESSTDYRKFYIHNGAKVMRLRAETKEDRWAWMQALRQAKEVWDDRTPETPDVTAPKSNARIVSGDNNFLMDLEGVHERLKERGATDDLCSYVEDLLMNQHQRYHNFMTAEADKRRLLLEYLHKLENDKRQLETAMVVESRISNKNRIVSRRSLGDTPDGMEQSEVGSEQSDTDADEDDSTERADSASTDEDEEVFYDALELARSGSLGSVGRSGSLDQALSGAVVSAHLPNETSMQEDIPGWMAKELPPPPRRDRLPPPAQQEKSVSLWSIIKECVGKDLSRICLPVYFNEPLSALQRIAEEMEYSELIDVAASYPPGSQERMLYVAAFAVSGYSSTAGRTSKPFNPLLGETYELVHAEKGLRAIVEKVVHHPTVLAAYGEGRKWTFAGDAEVKSKFWGRSIELTPIGLLTLSFNDGDVYTWNKVVSSINNLIIGKIYVDHGGTMRIHSSHSNLVCKLKFKEQGVLRMREAHEVRGHFELPTGEKVEKPLLFGKWDEAMYADMPDGSQTLLWQKSEPPPDPTRYNLTKWAIQLNEITPGLEKKLAPTDCRLRPDQHHLELGEYDQANAEKLRLETKQRAARKAAERGDPIRPRWFTRVEGAVPGRQQAYKYHGGYFEAREAGQWPGVRDIFGPGLPTDSPASYPSSPTAARAQGSPLSA